MFTLDNLQSILAALPDPAFILTRSGRYAAIFGGADDRYYHDGTPLVGRTLADVLEPEKAAWFRAEIATALSTRRLHIVEYSLSGSDVDGIDDLGPSHAIWFEGRIKALDFPVDGEDAVVWVASNITEKNRVERHLRHQSETDPLTGLFNRRRLMSFLGGQFEQVCKSGSDAAVLVFDIDNFKQINDQLGHKGGDEALVTVARVCRSGTRKQDFVSRLGGDEFVVIMPQTDAEAGTVIANRLRAQLGRELCGVTGLGCSISGGLSQIRRDDDGPEAVLHRADRGLYAAKEAGRNRIELQP